jgi:hypothetical protein
MCPARSFDVIPQVDVVALIDVCIDSGFNVETLGRTYSVVIDTHTTVVLSSVHTTSFPL